MKIEYSLASERISNEELENSKWSAQAISDKTGIDQRFVVNKDEFAMDLAVQAVECLFDRHQISREQVDFLLYCTQSPDYLVPTNACVLQDRLKLNQNIGALDFNLGCSAYPYGLSLAKGLIASGQAKNVLLVTAETYSKFVHPDDTGNRILFGDGASATLVDSDISNNIIASEFGTDGSGYDALMVEGSGMRPVGELGEAQKNLYSDGTYLVMDGGRIMNFALRTIPDLLSRVLEKSGHSLDDVDHFVFHQANQIILTQLQKKCGIPEEKFHVCMREFGNTVSNTIPIALTELSQKKTFESGELVMLIGFGVGLSWSGLLMRWA